MIFNNRGKTMKSKYLHVIPVVCVLLLQSCTDSKVNVTLEQAGRNRPELEKVLAHYREKGDGQKLKAAKFLVSNMAYNKFTYEGAIIERYDTLFTIFERLICDSVFGDSPEITEVWNYLTEKHGGINLNTLNKVNDSQTLTADFLIRNIDDAFDAWEKSRFYNPKDFNLFCEYVLPYRAGHEPLSDFHRHYRDEFKAIFDTVQSAKEIAQSFFTELRWTRGYRENAILWNFPLEFSAEKMERGRRGSCRQLTPWMVSILRAGGYAAAVDRAVWANRSQGHVWIALFSDKDKTYPFNALNDSIEFAYKPAKIFRKTYSYSAERFKNASRDDIPEEFFVFDETDVTDQYVKTYDITVPIQFYNKELARKKHGIICTFDNNTWKPVDWGNVKSGKMQFSKIAGDVMYLAAWYSHGITIPASEPFILHADGKLQFCKADTDNPIDMRLTRKYPRFKRMEDLAWGLRRTNAEASNRPDFRDSTVFFSIYDIPVAVTDSLVKNSIKYRYVRFNSSTQRNANFAEVEFYGKKTPDGVEEKLTGKIIGFPDRGKDDHPYGHAMDGNLETWFGKPKDEMGWVGLDLGKGNERIITRIRFCPRSDTNFILEGDDYELMCWLGGEWKSAGRKRAEQYNFIDFQQVPSKSMYLLHNHSRGREERIFTFENGEQVWW
jgi:hypothetical protein